MPQPNSGGVQAEGLGAPDASTQPSEPESSGFAFDVTATTYVPLSIGAQLSLEVPGRILLQGDLGWMPPGYGGALNGLVRAFGGYDPSLGSLVDGALSGAFVARLSAGWRPFPSAGFEITGGYTYVGLSGSVAPADVAGALGGQVAAAYALQPFQEPIELSSHLHNFHVVLGWRWVAFEHLLIRANIGYTQTLASSSSVNIPGHADLAAMANPIVDSTLSSIYKSYVKLPLLGVSLGYRF